MIIINKKEISFEGGMFYFCKHGIFFPWTYNGVVV